MMHRSFRSTALVLAVASLLQACSGTNVALQPVVKAPIAGTTPRSGMVVLPPGVNLAMNALKVSNSVSTTSPAANGSFTVTAYSGGPQLTFVTDKNGNLVLAGFLSSSSTTLDSLSTAKALTYFAAAFYTLPSPYRTQMVDTIATAAGFPAVQNAVIAALQANPSGLATNSGVSSALTNFVTALYAPNNGTSVSRQLRSLQGSRHLFDVLVNPSTAQSGITTINDFPDGVNFMNTYRRPAEAFIDQDSYVDPSGTRIPMPVNDIAPPVPIPPVSGLGNVTSSLLGAVQGLFSGATQYTPVSTSSTPLSNLANALSTRYIITVVGGGTPNLSIPLRQEESNAQRFLVVQQLVQDFLVPIVASIVIPNNSAAIDKALSYNGGSAPFTDLITTLTTAAPQIYTLMSAGQVGDALVLAFNTVATSNTVFAAMLTGFAGEGVLSASPKAVQAFFGGGAALLKSLDVLGGALVAADVAVVTTENGLSNDTDQFTVDVTDDTVTLTPGSVTLFNNGSQVFSANVPAASGSSQAIVWQWANTATVGHITDGIAGHLDNFQSSSNTVTYAANATGSGSDTVTVTALEVQGQNRPQIGNPQTATVTIQPAPSPSPSPAPSPSASPTAPAALGPPPGEPQSRCAAMQLSAHVAYVGQTISGTAGPPMPQSCGGVAGDGSVTWSWSSAPGLSEQATSCADNAPSCIFNATATTGSTWQSACIYGSSVQGSWESCDYYAIISASGAPAGRLEHDDGEIRK